jgi:hypothetical protein
MTKELNTIMIDIGKKYVTDIIQKSSFRSLLYDKQPKIRDKFDEIKVSLQYLRNQDSSSILVLEFIGNYSRFIDKYFNKFCNILLEEFAIDTKKSIAEFYQSNNQFDFNVLDWYYSFDNNDKTFYDFIKEPVQTVDVFYREMQGEEIHIDSDDTFYVKHQIKDYLRFWHKFDIYIYDYEEILIRSNELVKKDDHGHIIVSNNESDKAKESAKDYFQRYRAYNNTIESYVKQNSHRLPNDFIECYNTEYYKMREKILPHYSEFAIKQIVIFMTNNCIEKTDLNDKNIEELFDIIIKMYRDKNSKLFSEEYINSAYEEKIDYLKYKIPEKMKKKFGVDLSEAIWEDDNLLIVINDLLNSNTEVSEINKELSEAKDYIYRNAISNNGNTKVEDDEPKFIQKESLIPNFEPRWSAIVTPDVLLKCIELRKGCLVSTTIMKKTKEYFAKNKKKYFDYTTIRDWINDNKECINKFKNKKVSQIILTMEEDDIITWYKTLQIYEPKYSSIISEFNL